MPKWGHRAIFVYFQGWVRNFLKQFLLLITFRRKMNESAPEAFAERERC